MADFFLTPAFLVSADRRPAGRPRGLALHLREGGLWVAGLDEAGSVFRNPLAAAGWAGHLSAFRLPGRDAEVAPASLPRWFETAWHAEKACVCASRGDWEGVGVNADRCHEVSRAAGEPDSFADHLYADLRLAGAWGGQLCGGELSLWSPPGCLETLAAIVAGKGGGRVATGPLAD